MKKLILITFAIIALTSCEKRCDDMEAEAHAQYLKALGFAGGSQTAIMEVTRQYNEKLSSIQKNCR